MTPIGVHVDLKGTGIVNASQQRGQRVSNTRKVFHGGKMNPELLSWDLVKGCRDGKDAILLCIHMRRSGYALTDLAKDLGLDKGHFSRIMNRMGNFPDEKRGQLMELCGNLAPLQYEAWQARFDLVPSKTRIMGRIEELQSEIQQLQAAI